MCDIIDFLIACSGHNGTIGAAVAVGPGPSGGPGGLGANLCGPQPPPWGPGPAARPGEGHALGERVC